MDPDGFNVYVIPLSGFTERLNPEGSVIDGRQPVGSGRESTGRPSGPNVTVVPSSGFTERL